MCHVVSRVVTSDLFGHCVPMQVTLAHVHSLLVQELALIWDEQGVAYKLPN